MVTVCTQNELQNALKAKESRILIKGALAEKMKSKVKNRKRPKKLDRQQQELVSQPLQLLHLQAALHWQLVQQV